VDNVANELAEHERETRSSLARTTRRMAKESESLPITQAKLVHTVAQAMAVVHRKGEGTNQTKFSLNVLNLKVLNLDQE
jgi:hypothetical protein